MNPVIYTPQSKRLLEQLSEVLRYKHYSLKTGLIKCTSQTSVHVIPAKAGIQRYRANTGTGFPPSRE